MNVFVNTEWFCRRAIVYHGSSRLSARRLGTSAIKQNRVQSLDAFIANKGSIYNLQLNLLRVERSHTLCCVGSIHLA